MKTLRHPKQQRPETARAALYVRVSRPEQADRRVVGATLEARERESSLETQETGCRGYAAEHLYRVGEEHVYREKHTGVELWERPQLGRLRQAIRDREVDVVVAHSIDRFSRDPVHLGILVNEAERAGVTIVFVTETLDDSPDGQLVRFVRAYAGKIEHERIRERSMRGKLARAQSGRCIPGCRPRYGYRWRDASHSALEPDPLTAPIVGRIFRAAIAGQTLRSLATELTRECIPTPTGRSEFWQQTTLSDILSDEIYTGQATARRYRSSKPKERPTGTVGGRSVAMDQRVALPTGTVTALVDLEIFTAAAARLTVNRRQATRNASSPETFLLRGGFVKCGCCGRVCCGVMTGGNQYGCRWQPSAERRCAGQPSMRAHLLDADVWAAVKWIMTNPQILLAELERMAAEEPGHADVTAVSSSSAQIDRRRKNLVANLSLLDAESDTASAVRNELQRLDVEARALQREQAVVTAQRAKWTQAREQIRDLATRGPSVAAALDRMPYAERRDVLIGLGLTVTLYPVTAPERYVIETSRFAFRLSSSAHDSIRNTNESWTQLRVVLRAGDRGIWLGAA